MPPAHVVTARPHTVGRFRVAAWARYREAVRLAVAAAGPPVQPALRHGAIYLFGYVGELALKAAYFRLCPTPTGFIDPKPHMYDARHRAINVYAVSWPSGGALHFLPGWANLLVRERAAANQPFPQQFASTLLAHVNRLALRWCVELRYYATRPTLGELAEVRVAAGWLVSNLPLL